MTARRRLGNPAVTPCPATRARRSRQRYWFPCKRIGAAAAPTYRNGGPHGPTRDHVHLAPLLHCRQRARVRLARLRPLRLRRARRQRRRACQPGKGSQKGRPVLRERDHRDGERSGRHRGGPGREGRAHRVRRLGGRRPGIQGRGRVGGGPPGQFRAAGPHRRPYPLGIARLLRLQPRRPLHRRRGARRHQGVRRRASREGHVPGLRLHGQPLPRRGAGEGAQEGAPRPDQPRQAAARVLVRRAMARG